MSSYHIIDEPKRGALANLVVDPFWPLLATMLVGGGFGLAWLAFNAWAVGSPTRVRESVLCVAGFVAAIAGLVAVAALELPEGPARYAGVGIIVLKLAAAYWVTFLQQPAVEIHAYYGGRKQNGLIVLLVGMFGLKRALADVPDAWVWLKLLVL